METSFCEVCSKELSFEEKEGEKSAKLNDAKIETVIDLEICNECELEIKDYNPTLLTSIRGKFNLSQMQFAKILSLEEKTIRHYEMGEAVPNEQSLALYKRLDKDESFIVRLFENRFKELTTEEKLDVYTILRPMGFFKF